MALINCPECGRKISDCAPSCPHCGILREYIQAMSGEQQETTNVTCNKEEDDLILIKENALNELKKSMEAMVIAIQTIPKDQREKQLLDATGILFDAIEAYLVAIEAMTNVCNQEENNLSASKENALNELKKSVEAMVKNIQAMPGDRRERNLLEMADAVRVTLAEMPYDQCEEQLQELTYAMFDVLEEIPENQRDVKMIDVIKATIVYIQIENAEKKGYNAKKNKEIQIIRKCNELIKSSNAMISIMLQIPINENMVQLFEALCKMGYYVRVLNGEEFKRYPTISLLSDTDRKQYIGSQIDTIRVDRKQIAQLLNYIKTMHSEIEKMSDEQKEITDSVCRYEKNNQSAIIINKSTQFWDEEIMVYPTISILSDTDRIKFVNSWNREKM